MNTRYKILHRKWQTIKAEEYNNHLEHVWFGGVTTVNHGDFGQTWFDYIIICLDTIL